MLDQVVEFETRLKRLSFMIKTRQIGRALAVVAILCVLGTEVFVFLLNSTFNPDQLASQYFRLTLTLPVLVFFYLGFLWAIWLVRIGFVLGLFTTTLLLCLFDNFTENLWVMSACITNLIFSIFGVWIVFLSGSFKAYVRHRKRVCLQCDQ